MTRSPTEEFLDQLVQAKHHPELENIRGSVRIDLSGDGRAERWFLHINNGDVTVSRKNGSADCVLKTDKRTFDSIVTGKTNAMAAMLRDAVAYEGDPTLVVRLQRLFPASARVSSSRKGGAR